MAVIIIFYPLYILYMEVLLLQYGLYEMEIQKRFEFVKLLGATAELKQIFLMITI